MLAALIALAACEPAPVEPQSLPTIIVLPSETPSEISTEVSNTDASATAPAASGLSTATPDGERIVVRATPETATPSVTASGTPTETGTIRPSLTPSMTITDTPTRTVTITPYVAEDMSPLFQLALVALSSTPPPPGVYRPPTVTASPPIASNPSGALCLPPPGGFGSVYVADATMAAQIGCPLGTAQTYPAAVQRFERGVMVYLGTSPSAIYVLYDGGSFVRYADTWTDGVDPVSGGETPPAGLYEPIRGFGKVWRSDAGVRNTLGWATQPETGTTATLLLFQSGQMIALPPLGQVAVMTTGGTYRLIAGGA